MKHRVLHFERKHLKELNLQPIQRSIPLADQPYEQGDAYTVLTDRVVACGGVVWTEGGCHLWALIAENAPLLTLHRIAQRALGVYSGRITATTEVDFPQGCRWLEMLGFKRLKPLIGFGPNGKDHYLYERRD